MVHAVRPSQRRLVDRSHLVIGVFFTNEIENKESELLRDFNLHSDRVCLLFYL